MVDPAVTPRLDPLPALLLLFFVSGAAGLLYEVLWMRRLTTVFGATQLAVSTVLGAFMGGLAIGAWLGGRAAGRLRRPLVAYAGLEIVIGLWALAFPSLFEHAAATYAAWYDEDSGGWLRLQWGHAALVAGLLLPPSAAMGATLPLLVRHASASQQGAARAGLLYAANTAGAVLGTAGAAFVLLPSLGVRGAELCAAASNGAVAIGALWTSPGVTQAPIGRAPFRVDRLVMPILGIAAGSGFAAMVLEVVWTRLLTLMIGSSVYAFGWMLVAFLLGHAIGAALGTVRVRLAPQAPLRDLGWGLILAALLAAATHAAWPRLPFWFVDLYAFLGADPSWVPVVQGVLAIGVMTPATLGLGALFPLALAAAPQHTRWLAHDVSIVYVANTLGAAAGAICAGFFVLPHLGIQGSLLFAVVLLVLCGAFAGIRAAPTFLAVGRFVGVSALVGLAAFLVRPTLDPLLMSAGMYQYVTRLPDFTDEAVRNHAISDSKVLFWAEGTSSFVTVAKSLGSGTVWLANNGKIDASTGLDMPTQILIGHLPFLYRRDAKSALVVGLASGISAGSVTLQKSLQRIDVVEIEPAILTASRYFDHWSHAPLDDPRVRVIANDARNHLELFDGQYDVIINEPSNPWISGVSNLFTEDYLRLGRSRLAPAGLYLQWVQLYGMSTEDVRCLLRTFRSVFPHVLAFSTIEDADLILVGSRAPLVAWPPDLQTHLDDPDRREDLARIGISSPMDFLTLLVMDEPTVLSFAGEGPLNTDDNAHIEFSAPKTLLMVTQEENAEALLTAASGPWPAYRDRIPRDADRVVFLIQLGEAYERRKRWVEADVAYEEAVRRGGNSADLELRLARVTAAFKGELLEAKQLEAEGH